MQDLFYTPSSQSLILIKDNIRNIDTWNNITSLVISSSLYQIVAFNGTSSLAFFPINQTNLYYPPFPSIGNNHTSSILYSNIVWSFNIIGDITQDEISGSGATIMNLSSSIYYVSQSMVNNNGLFNAIIPNSYLLYINGSGSYNSYITLNDTTTQSTIFNISGSSPISQSFIPTNLHNYEVIFSIIQFSP